MNGLSWRSRHGKIVSWAPNIFTKFSLTKSEWWKLRHLHHDPQFVASVKCLSGGGFMSSASMISKISLLESVLISIVSSRGCKSGECREQQLARHAQSQPCKDNREDIASFPAGCQEQGDGRQFAACQNDRCPKPITAACLISSKTCCVASTRLHRGKRSGHSDGSIFLRS